nr:hypothetical protein 3 [Forsythia suspensa tombusvirus]
MPRKQVVVVKARSAKQKKKAPKTPTLLGHALRQLGAAGGGALGTWMGNPVAGSAVGHSLGGAISRWLGAGDYTVDTNSIVRNTLKASASIPFMHSDDQTVVIRHKEFVGEIRSSTSFAVSKSLELNPGNRLTFPWLASIASSFQEYRFKGLVFHYVPSSGVAVSGTNAALGTVMMQTSYRATDTGPRSKVEMLNEYCSNESMPSEPFAHPIECNPKENPFNVLYVRTGEVPESETKMMYDLGVTHIAVSGCPAAFNILGDLWVTYEVELKKPLIASAVTQKFNAGSAAFGAATGPNMFSTLTNRAGNMAISGSGNLIMLPTGSQGLWLVTFELYSSATFSSPYNLFPSAPTVSNATLAYYNARGGTYETSSTTGSGASAERLIGVVGIEVTDPTVQPQILLATPVLNGSISASYVTVTPTMA